MRLKRITIDQSILAGKPVVRRMRISVEQILTLLGNGMTTEEIINEFPTLEEKDIKAVLLYASKMISVEKVYYVEH